MKAPRFTLSGSMLAVAALAIDLGIIRLLHDGMWGEHLFLTLPTLNVLVAVGIAGFRRRSAFALGFVTVGFLSLIGFLAWIETHTWTFLRYAEPLCVAIDRTMALILPSAHEAAMYAVLAVGLLVPHTLAGVLGGWLTASGWRARRKSLPNA